MKTMLIVDDSDFMRALLKMLINDLDINVIGEAENGTIAVEKYKELSPDIVTMDIIMDESGGGMRALKEIMEYDPNAVVVIISSSAGQKHMIEQAMELGAKAFFMKPVDKHKFAQEIKRLLS